MKESNKILLENKVNKAIIRLSMRTNQNKTDLSNKSKVFKTKIKGLIILDSWFLSYRFQGRKNFLKRSRNLLLNKASLLIAKMSKIPAQNKSMTQKILKKCLAKDKRLPWRLSWKYKTLISMKVRPQANKIRNIIKMNKTNRANA